MARIYLASSWRNPYQPRLVRCLRESNHSVYDFRQDDRAEIGEPYKTAGSGPPLATAFAWSDLDPKWKEWTPRGYLDSLQNNPRAAQGYMGDYRAMEWADTCVLCLPAGNSAHIEAGFMKGRGKRLIIYFEHNQRETVAKLPDDTEKKWAFEPDLMYLLADNIVIGWDALIECIEKV